MSLDSIWDFQNDKKKRHSKLKTEDLASILTLKLKTGKKNNIFLVAPEIIVEESKFLDVFHSFLNCEMRNGASLFC